MDQGLGVVGIFLGFGLIAHGALVYAQCMDLTAFEFLALGCNNAVYQAQLEIIIGAALGGGCFFALIMSTDLEKPPKNPPLYKP